MRTIAGLGITKVQEGEQNWDFCIDDVYFR